MFAVKKLWKLNKMQIYRYLSKNYSQKKHLPPDDKKTNLLLYHIFILTSFIFTK